MARKQTAWKTKGMNRDLSVSAFNPEFAFDNRNLRLATNEGNTTMSWVNERGTLKLDLSINIEPWKTVGYTVVKEWDKSIDLVDGYGKPIKKDGVQVKESIKVSPIEGIPIGTAVLNSNLVVFTTLNTKEESFTANYSDTNPIYDCIYVFAYTGGLAMEGKLIYKGNLNFSTSNPLETLVSYEAEHIQKVYWTDGRNQPRLINIADIDHYERWNHVDSDGPHYATEVDTYFDFVPTIDFTPTTEEESTSITVERSTGGGLFAPGVIQYCFAYINKYGQESNIVAVSPLYYLSFEDRGASPEEKVTCSFHISVFNLDANFDAVRIYSIQRTSLNLEPIVRQFKDIRIDESLEAHYTDNGTEGVSMDPTELLYIGGKEISALTMTDKDQTLFIGNFTQKDASMAELQKRFDILRNSNAVKIAFDRTASIKSYEPSSGKGLYSYESQLGKSQEEISTFKGGEWYRFGFQLQKKTGEWTEPVFLKDVQNTLYPGVDAYGNPALPYARWSLVSSYFDRSKFKRIRPVVVYPNIVQRSVLCQGVLNPTVVNDIDAKNSSPDAQASWFFRPYVKFPGEEEPPSNSNPRTFGRKLIPRGSWLQYAHGAYLVASGNPTNESEETIQKRVEIQGAVGNLELEDGDNKDYSNASFHIDQTIVTLNSPDIEFDTDVQNCHPENLKLRIVGVIPITSSASAHDITTSTPMLEALYNCELNDVSDFFNINKPFGSGEVQLNISYINSKYAGNRLVADYLWNDVLVRKSNSENGISNVSTYFTLNDYMVYPWHKNGSLNNDSRKNDEASSVLKTKKESTIMFSKDSQYQFDFDRAPNYLTIEEANTQIHLTENDHVYNIRLKRKVDGESVAINYYPNIDKVLYNEKVQKHLIREDESSENTYGAIWESSTFSEIMKGINDQYGWSDWKDSANRESLREIVNTVVSMKYKSTSHAVIALPERLDNYGNDDEHPDRRVIEEPQNNYLLLGELYKEQDKSPFEDSMYLQWNVGGKAVDLIEDNERPIDLVWDIGDTYYQRYDCLKTYAFTNDDPNQIIEILSFMCETHVNIDGRYDRNRGQIDNTNMRPQIFNLLNPVYSQQDNFFNYQKLGIDVRDKLEYPNQITYSKTKISGADVDMWTNVTLASALELDGDKGSLNKLTRLNDQIIAFQDTGISQILYNENAAIATQQGVPIELANSGKVQGKRYLSDTIGCSNKWSIVSTPSGIYFMDSIGKNIFLFNGQLNNLSTSLGFNSWCKQNIPAATINWTSYWFSNAVSYYDKKNQEVLFIDKDKALAFSEKLSAFTSFYDYGGAPYFCNLDDSGLWLSKVNYSDASKDNGGYFIWRHHSGDYCRFFGKNKPYWMTLIGNPEPLTDKIFTNLEFRACVDGEGRDVAVVTENGQEVEKEIDITMPSNIKKRYKPFLPFDYLETWNEYQHGVAHIGNRNGHDLFKHHTSDEQATLKRKFRIWRCDIPRSNSLNMRTGVFDYTFDYTFRGGSKALRPLDRMRNPWLYINLMKDAVEEFKTIKAKVKKNNGQVVIEDKVVENSLPKAEIHDLVMTYFN